MSVTRRRFLQWSTVWCLLSRVIPVRASRPAPTPSAVDTLGAWLDTLIPADETPSATQLGVDKMLLAAASADGDYLSLLNFGRIWLDLQARQHGASGFAALDADAREAVAARAAGARPGSAQRRFFEVTRQDAFTYYYQQPGSWPGLGYSGPPQPLGYPDYTRAPERLR